MRVFKRVFTVFLLLAVAITVVPYIGLTAEAAYTPIYSTVKVGLNSPLRSSRPEVPSVTLANSSGFNFGSYDSSRNFIKTGETAAGTVTVTASGGTVTVTDSSGAVVASGSSRLAVVPKSDTGTAYTLPSASYGENYSYYGGFEFICSGSTMTVVNYIDIEKYVLGVIPYEMPAKWPKEALKAQALCARTYVANHLNFNTYASYGFDVCNTTACQVYKGIYTNSEYLSKVTSVVEETRGEYILYNGSLISSYFHASSGGATENSENVWSAALEYLRGVEDKYENTPSTYIISKTYTPSEIYSKMKAKDSTFNLSDVSAITYTTTAMGNIYSVTFTDSSGNTKTYLKENCRTKVLGAFVSDIKYTSQRFSISVANVSSLGDEEGIPVDEDFREIIEQDEGEQIIMEAEVESNYSGEPETESYDAEESMEIYDVPESEADAEIEDAAEDEAGGITAQESADSSVNILDNGAEEGLITETIELMADKTYTISSRGYGHNVGMSQYGACGMAEAGYTYEQIISYYYTGVTISPGETPFNDVHRDRWYYDAVTFVYQNGLFNGTSSSTFAPEESMTRGQLVTVLGRMSGINSSLYSYKGTISGTSVNFRSGPGTSYSIIGVFSKGDDVTITGKNGAWYEVISSNGTKGYVHGDYVAVNSGTFSDVAAGEYYTGYVEWAAKSGIVEGYSATKFGPNDPITREQMCTIIHRYAKITGKSLPEKVDAVTFSDDAQISSWAKDAVSALQKAGIVQGIGNNVFSPKANCIRAQVAQILKNYMEL